MSPPSRQPPSPTSASASTSSATRWMRWATGCDCGASRSPRCGSARITRHRRQISRSIRPAIPPAAPCRRCARRSNFAYGFEIDIEKGIPLASGMGGSAASAVAAVVAANALLEDPVPRLQLLEIRHAGRDRRERLRAPRQYRAVPVRRAGADRRHRSSAREANSGSAARCAACWSIRTCIWARARRAPC